MSYNPSKGKLIIWNAFNHGWRLHDLIKTFFSTLGPASLAKFTKFIPRKFLNSPKVVLWLECLNPPMGQRICKCLFEIYNDFLRKSVSQGLVEFGVRHARIDWYYISYVSHNKPRSMSIKRSRSICMLCVEFLRILGNTFLSNHGKTEEVKVKKLKWPSNFSPSQKI